MIPCLCCAGRVDLEELISAFMDLGIEMDRQEAKKLLKRYVYCIAKAIYNNPIWTFFCRMDKDGSLNISYGEWRDFLLLAPSTDILGLIKFWRHSTVSTSDDVGIVQ